LATASLVLVSTAAAGLVAAPAANADNNYVIVKVSDAGFDPATVNVKVGDPVIFVLQNGASDHHTITSDDGGSCPERPGAPCWPETAFDDGHPCTYRNFQLPGVRCLTLMAPGNFPYYDRYARDAGVDLHGAILVAPTVTPTTTTTVVPPSTTTTAPRPTTTTTAPRTTTTTGGAIQPLMVSSPTPSTATTWAPVALKVTSTAGQAPPPPTTATTVKAKAAKVGPATTTTTAPPAPPAGLFDTSTLTPAAPTPDPAPAAITGLDNSVDVQSALAGILHPDKPAGSDAPWLLLACGGFAALLLVGGGWAWFHRSSRYFPA
jgi:plastocyanin